MAPPGVCFSAAAFLAACAAWSSNGADAGDECSSRHLPPPVPENATAHNGVALPKVCYYASEAGIDSGATAAEHFFIIGDWGGLGVPPKPADNRKPGSRRHRDFVFGVDDSAQQLVAEQMKLRAAESHPRYVINVGDNFYWGGVDDKCAVNRTTPVPVQGHMQFEHIFERIYDGPHLEGKPWLGVLGNHDYGGWQFTKAWDQAVTYTWSSDRWVTPALYWSQLISHPGFTVEYFFVDTNVFDAWDPAHDPEHNICGAKHNLDPQNRWGPPATCHGGGPSSVDDCPGWFQRLWQEQLVWVEEQLQRSTADWRVVVTHFPPEYGVGEWQRLSDGYDIDLFITGHRHQQEVHAPGHYGLSAAYVVSGGGGGITSESVPSVDGEDDQYGFMDVTISRDTMLIEAISHGGILRDSTILHRRQRRLASTPSTTGVRATAGTGKDDQQRLHRVVLSPPTQPDDEDSSGDSSLIATAGVAGAAGFRASAVIAAAAVLSLWC